MKAVWRSGNVIIYSYTKETCSTDSLLSMAAKEISVAFSAHDFRSLTAGNDVGGAGQMIGKKTEEREREREIDLL